MTKEEAELEYANYLLDPDAYVLAKASDSFKNPSLRGSRGADKKPLNVKKAKMGDRRSPLLQAYIDEGGDDVKERIEKFERNNQIKALTIITLFSALLIFGKDYV